MRSGTSPFRILYKAHIYAGIFVAIHFAIFGITGLILLFKDEIQGGNSTSLSPASYTSEEMGQIYQQALAAAQAEHPDTKPLAIFPSDDDESVLNFRMGEQGSVKLRGSLRFNYDINHASALHEEKSSDGFFDWLLRLHREMLLGSNGKLYVGFVGILYVFMLLSGFFIYGKFMKGRGFGDLRVQTVPKLVDMHKFVGMVTFGWGLVVGLTGVFLAFNSVLIKLFLAQSLQHLAIQYQSTPISTEPHAPITQVVESALHAKPDSKVTYISYPNTEFGIPEHFLLLVNGTDPLTERLSEMVIVNAQSGKLTEVVQLPLYLKAVLLSEPLHFGDYGGLFLKVIWALFTICSMAVAGFGVLTYALKRAKYKSKRVHKAGQSRRGKYTYALPGSLALITFIALGTSLFTKGVVGFVAACLLLLPLSFLLRRDPPAKREDTP